MGGINSGRKKSIGRIVMQKAVFCKTVAEIVRETGAKPDTVRSVLRRASSSGEIAMGKFVDRKGNRRISVVEENDGVCLLEQIFFGVCRNSDSGKR